MPDVVWNEVLKYRPHALPQSFATLVPAPPVPDANKYRYLIWFSGNWNSGFLEVSAEGGEPEPVTVPDAAL